MRLNFLIHDVSRRHPFGGIKVQYEYANRLAARGHDVAIYHDLNFDYRLFRRPRSLLGLIGHNLGRSRTIEWFSLRPDVRCHFLPRIMPRALRQADATIFDSFAVAERLPQQTRRTGPLFHVVYEYPVWRGDRPDLRERLVRSVQRTDVHLVATSFAVEEMLAEIGSQPVAKITCGIDDVDASTIPPSASRQPIVGFAMRPEPYKRVSDLLDAVPEIRARFPQVMFQCFGRRGGRFELPPFVEQLGAIDDVGLRLFHQRCMIFVSPSRAEGWGLTAAEAMANGAAVVVTDDGGSRDFAVPGETALVVPQCQPKAIAAAVCALLADESLRAKVVSGGLERTRQMSWLAATERLERVIGSAL